MSDKPKTMQDHWERYHKTVYPEGLDPESNQYAEARGAYFCGALEITSTIQHISKTFKPEVAAEKTKDLINEVLDTVRELCKTTNT